VLIPLKLKYRTKYEGCNFKSKTNNKGPKRKTLWKLLQENAKKRGK
jgi:hypothetical protein